MLSDAEENIKEIGFKGSQSVMKAAPLLFIYFKI